MQRDQYGAQKDCVCHDFSIRNCCGSVLPAITFDPTRVADDSLRVHFKAFVRSNACCKRLAAFSFTAHSMYRDAVTENVTCCEFMEEVFENNPEAYCRRILELK